MRAFGGKITSGDGHIHGIKNSVPLFVGSSKQQNHVSKTEVLNFAQEIKEKRGKNVGTMIAWSFAKSAKTAVERLKNNNMPDIDLIQISLVELTSTEFKDHIIKLHKDYSTLLKFILPPDIVVKHRRLDYMTYKFDASESMALNIDENVDAKIISVQWDFEYNGRFTPKEKFMYGKKENGDVCPLFMVEYKFCHSGPTKIACRIQDNFGGEKLHVEEIVIE